MHRRQRVTQRAILNARQNHPFGMKNLVARAGATVFTLRQIHVRSIGEVDGGKPRGEYVVFDVDLAGKKRGWPECNSGF
jgi:hypothetical protein